MPHNRWRLSIDLDDLNLEGFDGPIDMDTVLSRLPEVARRIRASHWPRFASNRPRLEALLGQLDDPASLISPDVTWNAIYDEADADRVWLDTDGVERRRRERASAAQSEQ